MIRALTLADEKFFTQVTAASPRQIRSYLDQPINTPDLANHISAHKSILARFLSKVLIYSRKRS